jgi:predicted transcriptional regulator
MIQAYRFTAADHVVRRAKRVTISLPEAILEAADRVGARDHRSRSELVREALCWYLRLRDLPVDYASPEETEAFERGKEQIARGEYLTLEELLHDLEDHRRQGRAKKRQRVSA